MLQLLRLVSLEPVPPQQEGLQRLCETIKISSCSLQPEKAVQSKENPAWLKINRKYNSVAHLAAAAAAQLNTTSHLKE